MRDCAMPHSSMNSRRAKCSPADVVIPLVKEKKKDVEERAIP